MRRDAKLDKMLLNFTVTSCLRNLCVTLVIIILLKHAKCRAMEKEICKRRFFREMSRLIAFRGENAMHVVQGGKKSLSAAVMQRTCHKIDFDLEFHHEGKTFPRT